MKRALTLLMVSVAALTLWTVRPAAAAPEAQGQEQRIEHAAMPGSEQPEGHEGGSLIPTDEHALKESLNTAVWVVVIFLVMLAILYPTAWKGVLAGLKAREDRIRKDIADAEATRAKAEATLGEYNRQLAAAEERVREMLAKAQADGERLAGTIRDGAGKEAEAIKSKALGEIEEASKLAVAQIHEQAAELSTLIAEKIIRKNLNAEDQRELVRSSLQQLELGRK